MSDDGNGNELFDRVDEPGVRATIVEQHQSLVEYLAKRFTGRGEDLEDLVQVGNVGLLNAIERFDPDRGFKFSTFATSTIIGELKRHLRDKAWSVRVPRSLQEAALEVNRAVPLLTQRKGRAPTIGELAEYLNWSREDVVEARQAGSAFYSSSLDAPVGGEDDGATLVDLMGDVDADLDTAEELASVADAIKALPERERSILYLRFYRGMTQSEIAAQVGISQMHVSRLLSRSLTAIRRDSDADTPSER